MEHAKGTGSGVSKRPEELVSVEHLLVKRHVLGRCRIRCDGRCGRVKGDMK